MGPIIRHFVIDSGMEVVVFAVKDPSYSFCSHENKVDSVQQNQATKFVILYVQRQLEIETEPVHFL